MAVDVDICHDHELVPYLSRKFYTLQLSIKVLGARQNDEREELRDRILSARDTHSPRSVRKNEAASSGSAAFKTTASS